MISFGLEEVLNNKVEAFNKRVASSYNISVHSLKEIWIDTILQTNSKRVKTAAPNSPRRKGSDNSVLESGNNSNARRRDCARKDFETVNVQKAPKKGRGESRVGRAVEFTDTLHKKAEVYRLSGGDPDEIITILKGENLHRV